MNKKIIVALLVSIPILIGIFYFAVEGPSSIDNDVEKLAIYTLLKQDPDIRTSQDAIKFIDKKMSKIESKYKLSEREELRSLVGKKYMSLLLELGSESGEIEVNPLLHGFWKTEIENIKKISNKHSN